MTSCPHCPADTPTHPVFERYLEDAVFLILDGLNWVIHPTIYRFLSDLIWKGTLRTLILLGVIRLEAAPNESAFSNRSLIFFDEAKRRGYPIFALKFFGGYMDDFRVTFKGRTHLYSCTPLHLFHQSYWIDHKPTCKRFLKTHGFPHTEGAVFRSAQAGYAYGLGLGFPLVVKPENGSLSAHVTYPIRDEKTLKQAIQIAQAFQPGFIVERYRAGALYRVSVLGQKVIFVCRKEAPQIIGDGKRAIEHLFEEKNLHPERQDCKNTTLHPIARSEETTAYLATQGYDWKSIPPLGQRVTFSSKAILSVGCEIVECTDEIHPETRDMLLRVAQQIEGAIVGIDYITPDIRASYKTQETAILELNSRPYVDMHQHPSQGPSQPVASVAWDIVESNL